MVDGSSGCGQLALAIAIPGVGLGTAIDPATDSIMGSLPVAKAGVGSAMNDTTRQVEGALGVAILGSLLASSYSAAMDIQLASKITSGRGAVAEQVGEAAAPLVDAGRSALIDGMQNRELGRRRRRLHRSSSHLGLPARPASRGCFSS
jgi:hypothetical protein